MGKVIIFDFDGVLVDSIDAVFKMNQEAVAVLGKTITLDEYKSCFEEHINKRLASLLSLNEEEKNRMVDFKASIFPKYYNNQNVKLFDFAKNLVIEASKLGELWIVSSSPSDLIVNVLEPHGLINYFTKIVGQNKQPKNLFLQSALVNKKDNEVFFITDTTGDIKETRKIDIKILTIAVLWGFHSAELLKTENPDLLAQKPTEILDFIKSH